MENCGAEGDRSSQAEGPDPDDTLKSAVIPHADGATAAIGSGNLSGLETETQNLQMG